MTEKELQKKVSRTEKELEWYYQEKAKVEKRMDDLERERQQLVESLERASLTGGNAKPRNKKNTLFEQLKPQKIQNTLDLAKRKLTDVDHNISYTLQSMEEILQLVSGLYDHRETASKLLTSLIKFKNTKRSHDSASLPSIEALTKLPFVRDLARELLGAGSVARH